MVFKKAANEILETAMSVGVKSTGQGVRAMFNAPDLDPLKADKVLKNFNFFKQQLQHQLNDECKFDIIPPCLRHNLTQQCKIKNCNLLHICRFGATDQIMSDERCPS